MQESRSSGDNCVSKNNRKELKGNQEGKRVVEIEGQSAMWRIMRVLIHSR